MTTFTLLSNTSLSTGKPLTQSIVRAFRDNPLAIGEGDVSAPKIDPKALDNLAFSVYHSGNTAYSLTSGVETQISFTTKNFDAATCFNTSTNRFTPNKPGKYLITAQVSVNLLNALSVEVRLRKNGNGNPIAMHPTPTSMGTQAHAFTLMSLVDMNGTTDYIDMSLYPGGGSGTMTVLGGASYNTFISGFKVAG